MNERMDGWLPVTKKAKNATFDRPTSCALRAKDFIPSLSPAALCSNSRPDKSPKRYMLVKYEDNVGVRFNSIRFDSIR